MSLAPLDDQQTAALLESLLGRSGLPAEGQSPLLERAGGNPLYAEEFARLLTDRGLLTGTATWRRRPTCRCRSRYRP